jgi:manganese/iron transport system permease protein/iron/zinc/copper transport system permease protein
MTWDQLLEPYSFEFFRHGLVVATVAGALCGLIGTYVVLRGMSYIGHGLSHSIFGGAAASALIGFNFYIGAGIWGIASGLMIGRVSRRTGIRSDAAIGVITTASFAIGLALISLFGTVGRSIDATLFGSILGVSTLDVWVVVGVALAAGAVVFFRYRVLLFTTFDPEVAAVSGVATGRADALLMLVLTAAVLATMQVLGVILVSATLVIPPVVARMLTSSFPRMLLISSGIGAVSGFVGMNLSYHLDVSSGATIVLVSAALFLGAFLVTGPRRLGRLPTLSH